MSRPQPRAPGSFSPLPGGSSSASHVPARPSARRVDSFESEDQTDNTPAIAVSKTRQQQTASPAYAQSNASSSSLHHNFSRPARVPTQGSSSPLMKSHHHHHHTRKHSATPGLFEPTLPSTSTSNLSHVGMSHGGQSHSNNSTAALSASQIAAQAAVMSHQNSQQQQQQQQLHARQRSQTVPVPGDSNDGARRGSGSKGPTSPPMLSLTEASAPRETGFGGGHGAHQHDRLGGGSMHSPAATAAANVVFPRSGHTSPTPSQASAQMPPPPPPPPLPEKQSKSEKARAKLFSRPGKISTKIDSKEKPLPSPGKIGSALSALQRGNFSTTSLVDQGNQSLYSHSNSSAATIRATDTPAEEKGKEKEKEKRHHFLSRQKHKLKDEYHLPLSSAASNSLPTDPNAPSSLYNFNVPASPGPSSSSFAKAKKDKKIAERSESRLGFGGGDEPTQGDWPGPSSLPSLSQQSTMYDPVDPGKLGLHNHMTLDDAWPYLKAKLLVIFEGEDLRLPVEDFNRVVQMHIQYCIHRRSPNSMLEDLRDLLVMGFSSLDRTLRKTPEDRFIPALVELWVFTFTSILPFMQSVFLPLDLEVSGCGTIMTPDQARDFWGGVVVGPSSADGPARVAPAATVLDIRRLVLTSYRDVVILPRYDTLKTIFSRLSLEFLPSSFSGMAMGSPPPEASLSTSPPESFSSMARPGTAMSLDPSVGSYNSTSTTLLGEGSGGSVGGRSRAISNVSFGSHASDGMRPFTPSGMQMLGSVREQNVEDSKQVTDMVGRMLQCMSVLSSLGAVGDDDDNNSNRKVVELCKMLKLNWLGRGRTGRNRMGIVGGRVRREGTREELRVA
ncbi:Target of rapamycin complex 2 subunit-like protein [Hapsidospora chrysogenum ATCC 11550]|uniref:Target of rapamycin complex 2 subunit-like protein n=1 Tax=Hapsidospora chrysogenum (strain ATCC 11550 / CBS 779.69 / DSM 880 / IAM 14645 / JCM 23072 / IMI 49137) TaxID=857340 RepID=A0A086TG10_HAPC1|nr:Target of rapamycin complex 2 subunit-like protein [Hapsidospora chrysogenum ATCC 11550]